MLVSLRRVLTGLAVSLTLGTVLALAAGLPRKGEVAVDSTMRMARTLPVLGLVPLFILWCGIGEFTKIALTAFATTFPMYLALYSGIRGIDATLVEAARLFGLSYPQLVLHVILPGALPSFLVGLRHVLGVARLSLVAVEQINATAGLGYLINKARDFMRTDVIVVCLLVYSLLGLAHRENAWPVTLSGGEAQRVALEREPQLLLLDEPFAALDALTRIRMHRLILQLWRKHRPAVLLVTHDVD